MSEDTVSAEVGPSRLPAERRQCSRSPDDQPDDTPRKRPKSVSNDADPDTDNPGSSIPAQSSESGANVESARPYRAARPYWPLDRSKQLPLMPAGSIYAFERLNHIQEGTYGVVFRARDRFALGKSSEVKAVKKLKLDSNTMDSDGFPISSLREIQTLRLAWGNRQIVSLNDVCVGKTLDQVFLVMEFMEHDLKTLMLTLHKQRSGWAMSEVKQIMHQLTSALDGLHANWIVHRDLKSSNVLMDNRGNVKLADFGLARRFGDPPQGWTPPTEPRTYSKPKPESNDEEDGGMTDLVVTLWYRAPELLVLNKIYKDKEATSRKRHEDRKDPPPVYDEKIDIWSLGCIFAELLLTPVTGKGLFQAKDEQSQLALIEKTLGPMHTHRDEGNQHRLQDKLEDALKGSHSTKGTSDLLAQMFEYNPKQRVAAEEALKHEWFTSESPRMAHRESMPTFPSSAVQEPKPVVEPSAPNPHINKEGRPKDGYEMEFDFDI